MNVGSEQTILILGDVESASEGDTNSRAVEVTLLILAIVRVVCLCLQATCTHPQLVNNCEELINSELYAIIIKVTRVACISYHNHRYLTL